ncbi:MAG: NAD-dependent epimerase/dehydratase family protein, partial [Phycisphaerales bacterium]
MAVTGGAGFIGSHLADALVALGADVTLLDDLSNGRVREVAPDEPRAAGDRHPAAGIGGAVGLDRRMDQRNVALNALIAA